MSDTRIERVTVTPPELTSTNVGDKVNADAIGRSKSCPYTLKFKTLIALKTTNTTRIIRSFLFIIGSNDITSKLSTDSIVLKERVYIRSISYIYPIF